MTILLAIDPGITPQNPTGLALFNEDGELSWTDLITPIPLAPLFGELKSALARINYVMSCLDWLTGIWRVSEIACEEIRSWKGRQNLEGLVVLKREIKALAESRKIPISFYTPLQWHGRLKEEVWMKAMRQEWGLGAISKHEIAAVGIGAYHLARQVVAPLLKNASEVTGIWDMTGGENPVEHVRRMRDDS